MSLSNSFETHTLKYLLTSDSVTRPTAWYVALCTTDPTDSALGTEVSGGGMPVSQLPLLCQATTLQTPRLSSFLKRLQITAL